MATQEDSIAAPMPAVAPFYYGWVNVVMGALAMTATLPGRTHGLGLITKPLLEDLGMREEVFSYLNFGAILLGTLFAWPITWLLDRWGTRLVGGAILLGLGASVAAMSFIHDEMPLFGCMLLVRGLGQGALSVASMAMVGKWFSRRIGLAMGVYSVLLGIGFIASVPTFQWTVQQYGWRGPWFYLGVVLLCGLGPLTLLLVRSAPPRRCEEFDAAEPEPLPGGTGIREGEPPYPARVTPPRDATLMEALCSPAFWVYSVASSMFGLTWSAITLFYELILAERGFGSDTYRSAMTIFVAVGMASNLLGGWACRHWPMGRLLGIGLLLLAASLGFFPLVGTEGEVMAFTAVFGASGGLITVIYFSFYGKAYGRSELGRIQGAAHVLSVFASALGPVLLTWTRENTGSYDGFFYGGVPALVLLGLAGWWVHVPGRSERPA